MMDEFGLELRNYYLQSVIDQCLLLEAELGTSAGQLKIKELTNSILPEWLEDAKKNEVPFFAQYLENCLNQFRSTVSQAQFARKFVKAIADYAQNIKHGSLDSADLVEKYDFTRAQSIRFLHCRYGQQDFLIPVANVVEVITNKNIFPLPDARAELLGMLNFRGEGVPVLNFRHHGFEIDEKMNQEHSYVICESANMRFAFEVSQTSEVIEVSKNEMQKLSQVGSLTDVTFIEHCVTRNHRTMLIFNLEKLIA